MYSSLDDCGIRKLYSDIETIVDACENPAALTKLVIKEAICTYRGDGGDDVGILFHGKELTHDIHDMINNWQSGNFYQSGAAFGRFSAIILNHVREVEQQQQLELPKEPKIQIEMN